MFHIAANFEHPRHVSPRNCSYAGATKASDDESCDLRWTVINDQPLLIERRSTMKRTLAIAILALIGASGSAVADPTIHIRAFEQDGMVLKTEATSYMQSVQSESDLVASFNP
jgi:hypothetical protein